MKTNFFADDCDDCKVHAGYYNALTGLMEQFDDVLLKYYIKKYPEANL